MLRSLAVIAVVLALSACGGDSAVKKDATQGWSVEKLYAEAKAEATAGNYRRAISYFERLSSRFPYGKYAQQSQLDLAYAYFKDREPASAIATCDRFLKLYPNHPNADYAYFLKGLISFNEDLGIAAKVTDQDMTDRDPQAMRESFYALQELVTRYPESRYTPDALRRMQYLVNALASAEVKVADYYLRRKAYVAAVNRAQFAIDNYPQAPALERALEVLAESYRAMGLTDLEKDAMRMLSINFPKSARFAEARPKPWWKPF
jgi:outer membrane protein assembly factor BamD